MINATLKVNERVDTLYIHTHDECIPRWMIDYLRRAATLNERTFRVVDEGGGTAAWQADLVMFGNSCYAEASTSEAAGVHVVRNPLSVLVAAYRALLSTNSLADWPQATERRALLQRCTIEEGFLLTLAFLERPDFRPQAHGPFFDLRHWDYDDSRFALARIEDVTAEPGRTLRTWLPEWSLPADKGFHVEPFESGASSTPCNAVPKPDCDVHDWRRASLPQALLAYVATQMRGMLERCYPEVLLEIEERRAVPFYERPEDERMALTRAALATRQSLRGRWVALDSPEARGWDQRAARAAALLAEEPAIADLGCGTMTLAHHLSATVGYHPMDITRRDGNTTVCDFNRERPPPLPAPAAACLGLLEYLFDPAAFLRTIASQYRSCAVSYCPVDAPEPLEPRRAHGWVNDLTKAQIEAAFQAAGWRIASCEPMGSAQFLWHLKSC